MLDNITSNIEPKYTIILVEGKNNKLFLEYLLEINSITLLPYVKIVSVEGKPKFNIYLRTMADGFHDLQYKINYKAVLINKTVIIKDFDEDDNSSEEFIFRDILKSSQLIHIKNTIFELKYIAGNINPPQILETLIIENNGIRLKHFHKSIKEFYPEQRLEKANDKNIFESYLKLTFGKIEYSIDNLKQILNQEHIKNSEQLIKLVEYIKSL